VYEVACDSRDAQNIASPNKARPALTMTLLPMRTASRVPATDVTTTAAASGSNRTPVLSGLYDFTTWKY
jgi:aspartate-semialdehyde dehydrogenase